MKSYRPPPPLKKNKTKKNKWHLGIDYKRNGIVIWKVILDYGTITISLSVSEDPIQFGPEITKI